jgi:hypothetical protein
MFTKNFLSFLSLINFYLNATVFFHPSVPPFHVSAVQVGRVQDCFYFIIFLPNIVVLLFLLLLDSLLKLGLHLSKLVQFIVALIESPNLDFITSLHFSNL